MLRIQRNFQNTTDHQEDKYVPLKRVHINATIRSFAANATITQVFRNDESQPIEAVYCFPIEEKAAVYSFTARIDDREIVAQLKEKKEAQQEYHHALQQGHGAYLLEQDENSQDNFIINVGTLLPTKECTILIAYVTELEFVQQSTIRLAVPTTIAPRYNPNKGSTTSPAGTSSKYVQSTPYTIQFRCQIERSQDEYITRINSSSHPIQIDFGQQDAYVITFAQQNTHLDRDILINIELSTKRANTIVAVESEAVMAVFTPSEEECRQQSNTDQQTNEFLFVIDCSGSMRDENKIGLARQATLLFLKNLPVDCYFNIIRFGSNFDKLFPEITDIYNERNVQQAEQLINRMEADLGGTELFKPLEWIEQHSPCEGRARQIFLLTDGEISHVTEVLDLCRSMATSTRIFSFGLGNAPSRSLVKGLARSTNGRFVFIPPNSNVDTYVGEQLRYALQPCIINLDVQWNLGANVQSAPKQPPPVYADDRLIVYALINDKSSTFDHHSSVVLKNKLNNCTLATATVDRIPNVVDDGTIARLAAKALILELQHSKTASLTSAKRRIGSTQKRFQQLSTSNEETAQAKSDEQTTKQRIIDLSLKYHILSPHTAFVGIEKRTDTSTAEMILREVPIEISADDQYLQTHVRALNFHGRVTSMNKSYVRRCSAGGSGGFGLGAGDSRGGRGGCNEAAKAIPLDLEMSSQASCMSRHRRSNQLCRMGTADRRILDLPLEGRWSDSRGKSRRRERSRSRSREASPIRYESEKVSQHEEVWPSNDEDIVRYLIRKQKYDGLWDVDTNLVMNLTGKPLSAFNSADIDRNTPVIISIIIVLLLETRFATFASLWPGVVQKARKRISHLVRKDSKNFDLLVEDIRKQL